jgi:L,D-transpeptidase catalytic domain
VLKFLNSKKIWTAGIASVGLGLAYQIAVMRGIITPIGQWARLSQPITCPADVTLHQPPVEATLLNNNQPLGQLLPRDFDRVKTSILIEKSNHRLTLYYNQKPVKSYAVVFGDPQEDKRREGDLKTPEGILRIQDKYPHPKWSKFLWLDYPNAQSQCKHDRAKQRGEIPLSSGIGGEVGIHGVPMGADAWVDNRKNWTWGCPSLKTKNVDELYEVVQVGTIVEIVA